MGIEQSAESARDAYDQSASLFVETIGTTISSSFETQADQGHLRSFAARVLEDGGGPVVDIGCGPGRATAFLHDLCINISGIDISSAMVEAARAAHPHLSFSVGSLTDVPAARGSLAGVVLWYSIIHTPLAELDLVWKEISRVLAPGGVLLAAFQSGANEATERPSRDGSPATLTSYRHLPDDIVVSVERSGFLVQETTTRKPSLQYESTPQTFVLATHR